MIQIYLGLLFSGAVAVEKDGAARGEGHLLTIAPTALALRGRLSRPIPPWVLYAESVGDFLDCEFALL
jgi:hypothetical protein